MRRPTPVSAAVDTRLIYVLTRMAMQVLDTGAAVSSSVRSGGSAAQTTVRWRSSSP